MNSTVNMDIDLQQRQEELIMNSLETLQQQQLDDIQMENMDFTMSDHGQLPMDDFNLMFSDLGGGIPNNIEEDLLGDINMDVTEADFDFFETAAASKSTITSVIPTVTEMTPLISTTIPTISSENTSFIPTTGPAVELSPAAIAPLVSTEEAQPVLLNVTAAETTPCQVFKDTPLAIDTPLMDNSFTPFHQTGSIADVGIDPVTHIKEERSQLPPQKEPVHQTSDETPLFVPRNFMPVSVHVTVDDAKYTTGGKFMYPSSKSNAFHKEVNYSPDYIPLSNLKKTQKSRMELQDVDMKDLSTSSQESSETSISSDMSDSDSSSDTEVDSNDIQKRRLKSLAKFQKHVAYSTFKSRPTPSSPPFEVCKHRMDYDIPFVKSVAGDCIKPVPCRQNELMKTSVDYLCQQAIFGGYPFASGLAEVTTSGGEIEVEPAKVMVARRTNLMQMTHGSVTHTPSLHQVDFAQLTSTFKTILNDLFAHHDSVVSETVLKDAPLGKTSVKGPLSIHQLYTLNGNTPPKKNGRKKTKVLFRSGTYEIWKVSS